MMIIDGDV